MTSLLRLLELQKVFITQYLIVPLCTFGLRDVLPRGICFSCCCSICSCHHILLYDQLAYSTLGRLGLNLNALIDGVVRVGSSDDRRYLLDCWQLEVVVSHEDNPFFGGSGCRIKIILVDIV